jgi:3-deoxy-manno-octulosonate cytidylyltransferase (CMP-KDO synthetase)
MKVIGIIPARYESTRFPGKAIATLQKKPIIWHVHNQVMKVPNIDEVIVATDHELIFDTVIEFGGKAVLTSKDHKSGTDRIAEVAKKLDCDIIVNVQGDEPLINPKSIESAIRPIQNSDEIVMSTLMKRIVEPDEYVDPNVVKVVTCKNGYAMYFSRYSIPYYRNHQELSENLKVYPSYKHIGLYVYTKQFLLEYTKLPQTRLEISEQLEQLRALEYGYKIKVVETEFDTIGIDTPEDLEKAEKYMAKYNS